MFDFNILKLRLKYAWNMLFSKDFFKEYNRVDKYSAFIDLLSKGRISVDTIDVYNEGMHRVYHCKVDYSTLNSEACFDFRRLCCLNPVMFPEEEYKQIAKMSVK